MYDDKGIMNATIITTNEEVEYHFWYPKRNKVINEYKYIKDNYSWDDEFEFEGGPALSTHSPKIYDLRTPQKKSRKSAKNLDDSSEKWFDLSKITSKCKAKQ